MNFKDLQTQIGFREIQFPKIFSEEVQQISGSFNPKVDLFPNFKSIYPNFSKKRLNEFLAGRICALNALDLLGFPQEILPIEKNKTPKWPAGITGSITHTRNKASAVVLPSVLNLFLGLDLEDIFTKNIATELEGKILLKNERRFLNLENYSEIITLIYSAKESVFKAINSITFRFLDFKEIEIIELNFSSNFFEAKLNDSNSLKIKGKFAFMESLVLTGAEIKINT